MLLAIVIALVMFVPAMVSFRSSTRWIERRLWRRQLQRTAQSPRLAKSRGCLVAAPSTAYRHSSARSAIFRAGGIETKPGIGLPARCRHRRNRPGLGNELVFRYGELGVRLVELAGRVANRQLARGNGARGRGRTSRRRFPFAVQPAEISGGDFSFIVIGDTGEGDASQHVLRDQLLAVADGRRARFIVISSDVVYPNGSMIDYEASSGCHSKG